MINFEALEDMIRVNEEKLKSHQIFMGGWFHPCQTHGCLCGNYALIYKPELQTSDYQLNHNKLRKFLGLTPHEFAWLFQVNPLTYFNRNTRFVTTDPADMDGEPALNRLKKFVAYKKAKASVSLERGRHISGTNICHRLSLGV